MLIERATGKRSLAAMARNGHDDKATAILCEAIAGLQKPRGPVPTGLIPLETWFKDLFPMAAKEGGILARSASAATELLAAQREIVPLHADVHHDNVLDFEERGWLAIDTKPLVGEREFDTASLLSDRRDELAQDRAAARRLRRRLDQLCSVLNLDRDRARRWGIAHALAWGFSGQGWDDEMIACARWLADA